MSILQIDQINQILDILKLTMGIKISTVREGSHVTVRATLTIDDEDISCCDDTFRIDYND